jgi:hypothetical protein
MKSDEMKKQGDRSMLSDVGYLRFHHFGFRKTGAKAAVPSTWHVADWQSPIKKIQFFSTTGYLIPPFALWLIEEQK